MSPKKREKVHPNLGSWLLVPAAVDGTNVPVEVTPPSEDEGEGQELVLHGGSPEVHPFWSEKAKEEAMLRVMRPASLPAPSFQAHFVKEIEMWHRW